jgi:lysophospholipase L1-like esterase
LIIGEPFAVQNGSAITSQWDTEFPAYRQYAREIANNYEAVFIPYQEVFDKALKIAPASYWCPDGVHPSIAGAYLMKNAWMEGVERLYN